MTSTPFNRFLDLTGDGSGSKDGAADFSTPDDLKIVPSEAEVLEIHQLKIIIQDVGAFTTILYGAVDVLTAGVGTKIALKDNADADIADFTDGLPIKSNAEFAKLSGATVDMTMGINGAATNQVEVTVKFPVPVKVSGPAGEYFAATLSDDLSGLVEHWFIVSGQKYT